MCSVPPEVSVIIPTYNRARVLRRGVESVLAQTYQDFEVIVVDDASSDDTQDVLLKITDPRLRLIRHETNRGATAARNSGIEVATGVFVAFQDSDDEWLPEKLAKQMALFQANPSASVVYSGMLRNEADGTVYIPGPQIRTREGDLLDSLLYENFVGTPSMVVRRECLEETGGFLEDLPRFQDWELVIRLAKRYPLHLVDEPLVIVHATPENISSDPGAGAVALEMILDRHHAIISRDRRALAHFHLLIGRYKYLNGDHNEARGCFARSIRVMPWSLNAWAGWLLSCLGPGAFVFGRRLRRRIMRRDNNRTTDRQSS